MPGSWPLRQPRSRVQPSPKPARGRQSRCWKPSSGPRARGLQPDVWDSMHSGGDTMTDPIERPQSVSSEVLQRVHEGEPPPVPGDRQIVVQQLREAGFSEDQQAVLTTALLRVLALWTQQATRGDLQTELHAGEQRLAQQLDTLREEIRREIAQHTQALREALQNEFARHADLLRTTRI